MIQLNLLPDIKLQYLKAERSRRLVVSTSLLISAAAIVFLVLLLLVDVAQKKHISDLNHDIASETSTLQHKPNINNVLTVQNQLESLTTLHAQKPAADRLFNTYIDEVTPANVSINGMHVDFTQQTVTISGTADNLSTVNKYVDTLKFTTYTTDSNTTATKAFSNVVLSSFGLGPGSTTPGQAATYSISFSYDKPIFDITQNTKLTVPNLITTRSALNQPGDLFKAAPPTSTGSGGTTP